MVAVIGIGFLLGGILNVVQAPYFKLGNRDVTRPMNVAGWFLAGLGLIMVVLSLALG